ncbi:MAG TPA: hypothetical protein VF384_08390 [Planctomycetota bacterium]
MVTIDDKSPAIVTIHLAEALTEVVVRVEYPSAEVLCSLLIEIRDEHGRFVNVANYRPERGVIRRLVTGETAAVRVTSVGYDDVEIGPQKLDASKANVIDVRLTARAR